MSKNILSLVEFARPKSGAAAVGMHPAQQGLSHQRAFALPESKSSSPKRKPQHLIGLLFAHGSRTRRACLPRAEIKMSVFTPAGKNAVTLRV